MSSFTLLHVSATEVSNTAEFLFYSVNKKWGICLNVCNLPRPVFPFNVLQKMENPAAEISAGPGVCMTPYRLQKCRTNFWTNETRISSSIYSFFIICSQIFINSTPLVSAKSFYFRQKLQNLNKYILHCTWNNVEYLRTRKTKPPNSANTPYLIYIQFSCGTGYRDRLHDLL